MDTNQILNTNILKIWSKFVIPTIIGVVLNTIYTAVDAMFVGQCVGEAGLASINIAWPAVTIIIGLGTMIGVGSSSIISTHLGKNEKQQSEKCLGTTVKSILVIGSILMVIGILFREPILNLLGATADTIDYARDYYTIMYIIAIPYIFSTALNPIVRTDGKPNLSMIMICVGAICNIILDYILVMRLDYGIKGAAIATSASIFISMIVSLYYFIKGSSNIKIKKEYFKIDVEILKEIFKIGFVSFAIQLSYGVILLVQNNVIYMYGNTTDVAIFTVAAYINCFIVNLFMGIAQGVQPLIGYHYGASKYKRMNNLIKINIGVSIIGGIICYILLMVFAKEAVSLFGINKEDLEFASNMMLLYCVGTPIIGILFTSSAFYQVIRKNLYSNIISISRGFVFQFLFTIIIPPYIGVAGVFLSLPLAELVSLLFVGIIILVEKNNRFEDERITYDTTLNI